MKLSLALEVILLLVKTINSEDCRVPHGIHIHHNGPISTLSCLQSGLGIEYNKKTKKLTLSRFLRVMCSDDMEYLGLGEKNKNVFFCTENLCNIKKSKNLSTNFQFHFNNTVIRELLRNEIYYCFELQWRSLFEGELPVELKSPKAISTSTSVRYMNKFPESTKPTILDVTDENEFEDLEEGHFNNDSKLNIRYSRQPHTNSVDLCLIAIIFTIVCSILFIITIVLLISSRIFLKHQIKSKLMTPLGYIGDPQPLITEKERIIVSQDQYVVASQFTSSAQVTNCKPMTTSDIEDRYH